MRTLRLIPTLLLPLAVIACGGDGGGGVDPDPYTVGNGICESSKGEPSSSPDCQPDPPVLTASLRLSNITIPAIAEDAEAQTFDLSAAITDPDNQITRIEFTQTSGASIAQLSFDSPTRTLTVTPLEDQNGTVGFSVTVTTNVQGRTLTDTKTLTLEARTDLTLPNRVWEIGTDNALEAKIYVYGVDGDQAVSLGELTEKLQADFSEYRVRIIPNGQDWGREIELTAENGEDLQIPDRSVLTESFLNSLGTGIEELKTHASQIWEDIPIYRIPSRLNVWIVREPELRDQFDAVASAYTPAQQGEIQQVILEDLEDLLGVALGEVIVETADNVASRPFSLSLNDTDYAVDDGWIVIHNNTLSGGTHLSSGQDGQCLRNDFRISLPVLNEGQNIIPVREAPLLHEIAHIFFPVNSHPFLSDERTNLAVPSFNLSAAPIQRAHAVINNVDDIEGCTSFASLYATVED